MTKEAFVKQIVETARIFGFTHTDIYPAVEQLRADREKEVAEFFEAQRA